MKGIVFHLTDGTKDWYDPLNESDLEETETHYILNMHYQYEIEKSKVVSYNFYDLCNGCKQEVHICECED